jgi:hypothetical protein
MVIRLIQTVVLTFLICAPSQPASAVERFEENFNFGALDQNLIAELDSGFTYTVHTNGNGYLYLKSPAEYPPQTQLWAKFTTAFETTGDFTNTVTAYSDETFDLPRLGVKLFTSQGSAQVHFVMNNQIRAEVDFPTLTTNRALSVTAGQQKYLLQIRRTGNTLSLGFYEESGVYRSLLQVTEPALALPAKLQLFAGSWYPYYNRWGTFDDWVIYANGFVPTPVPRLVASIVPVAFQISWPSYTNRQYQVWSRPVLSPDTWTPLGPPTNGTGYMMSVIDWVLGLPQRFYRVVEVP